ncbi:MAG: hypothetical protein VKJ04_00940 [Vampirovibrionales bacterium]|nr:hypothetical protein [Vampirovibrionales bacterium]
MLYLAVAILLTLAIRLSFLLRYPTAYLTGDAVVHLLYIKMIRNNQGKIPDKDDLFNLDHPGYPHGYHKLLALTGLPLETIARQGKFLPTVFDTLLLIFIGIILITYGGGHTEWLLLFPLLRIFWGNEGRAFHFNERAYGVLFCNIFLASMFISVQFHSWPWLLPALLGFTVFSTSSKFSWQAAILYTVILSILTLNPVYLLVFVAVFAVSAILTLGYNIKVLKELIRNLYVYKTFLAKKYLNLGQSYAKLWKGLKPGKRFIAYRQLFFKNSLLKLVSDFAIVVPFLSVWYVSDFHLTPWHMYALTGIILLPLIATEALKFIGEPERYLEFCVFPIFFILSFYSGLQHWPALLIGVMIGTAGILHQFDIKNRQSGEHLERENGYADLEAFLRGQKPGLILTVDIRLAFRLAYKLTGHRYVGVCRNFGSGEKLKHYMGLFPDYFPYPGNCLSKYIEEFGINYLVVDKIALLKINKATNYEYYNFSNLAILYDSESFSVYTP